jgi:hypothetical protein
MRAFVTGLVLVASAPAHAIGFLDAVDGHLSLSGGGGLAHGVGGVKLELRLAWIAAFGSFGLVGVSGYSPGVRLAVGGRLYLLRTERGAGFISVEYAQARASYRERPSCCEWFEIKEANLGGVIGYRYAFVPGFFGEIGVGPAWNWFRHEGVGFTGTYSDTGTEKRFGLTKELKIPNFDLALGFEW